MPIPKLNLFAERWQGQLCQPEVHLSEGDADNRDAENEAVEDVGEPYPDAANEEPQDIRFKWLQPFRWWQPWA